MRSVRALLLWVGWLETWRGIGERQDNAWFLTVPRPETRLSIGLDSTSVEWLWSEISPTFGLFPTYTGQFFEEKENIRKKVITKKRKLRRTSWKEYSIQNLSQIDVWFCCPRKREHQSYWSPLVFLCCPHKCGHQSYWHRKTGSISFWTTSASCYQNLRKPSLT